MTTGTIERTDTITTWEIDPAHTQVEFEVKHMMFAKVRGSFTSFEGSIDIGSDDNMTGSKASVRIESSSIDTGNAERDKHLRSGDFFDTEQYPELRFESRTVDPRDDGGLDVTGDLTIRDVTHTVLLDVTESGRGTDPWGGERIGFTASTMIDRRDFGLEWNQALEAGGVLVGHDVRIVLEVQAIRQDA
jgi:polyisoprenoid-binding protein YceI